MTNNHRIQIPAVISTWNVIKRKYV